MGEQAEQEQKQTLPKGFGKIGVVLMVYLLLCWMFNTSINTGWQNSLGYWNTAFGWNTTTLMSLTSAAQFIGIFFFFLVGRLLLRNSARMLAIIFLAIAVVGSFSTYFVRNMALFGVVEIITILAEVVLVFTINPTFIASWFPRKKGIVMGIITIGVPAGSGTVSRVMTFITNHIGQQYCMWYCTLIGLVALILLTTLVRNTPEECGEYPDNDKNLTTEQVRKMTAEAQEKDMQSPWTAVRMLKMSQTYRIALPLGFLTMLGGGIMATNMLHMTSIGYSTSFAANVMLFTAGASCLFSYLLGMVDTKFGPRIGTICVFIGGITAPIFHILGARSIVCLFIAMALTGVIVGGAANFLTSLTVEYWGAANFKRAYGVLLPVSEVIGTLGTFYVVQMAARFGSYDPGYIGFTIFSIAGLIVFLTVRNGDFVKKKEDEWEAQGLIHHEENQ